MNELNENETITYEALDEGRRLTSRTWTGPRSEALSAAIDELGAVALGADEYGYAYYADETDEWYLVDADGLVVLGAALLGGGGDAYSLWCADPTISSETIDAPSLAR